MTCFDAPACGCCDPQGDYVSPELALEMEQAVPRSPVHFVFLSDCEAVSAGMGMEEDYRDDIMCEGYDEH